MAKASDSSNTVLRNEEGIALMVVMVLSTIALAIMSALIYMTTSGTQISGMQKRYATAYEAGKGGSEVVSRVIALRGEDLEASMVSQMSYFLNTSSTCKTNGLKPECTALGNFTGLTAKVMLPTDCWTGCDKTMTIDSSNSATYDMRFDVGTNPSYRVFAKIVDTKEGNVGGDADLVRGGVVQNTGEVNVVPQSFYYTIEVQSINRNLDADTAERAKLSILYQY